MDTCASQLGCYYVSQNQGLSDPCKGVPWPFSSFGSQSSCHGQQGCAWYSDGGSGSSQDNYYSTWNFGDGSGSGDGLSGGATFGVVLCVLIVIFAGVFIWKFTCRRPNTSTTQMKQSAKAQLTSAPEAATVPCTIVASLDATDV